MIFASAVSVTTITITKQKLTVPIENRCGGLSNVLPFKMGNRSNNFVVGCKVCVQCGMFCRKCRNVGCRKYEPFTKSSLQVCELLLLFKEQRLQSFYKHKYERSMIKAWDFVNLILQALSSLNCSIMMQLKSTKYLFVSLQLFWSLQ